jgi:serine phosphatase RsbU (regulator of sigma subunit)
MSRKVIEQAGILKAHIDEHQREAELARRILDHQIRPEQMQRAGIRYSVMPASNFSGDMVLAACSPAGCRYAMLADATGHGLAAAVSILPLVQEFYRLVELDQPLPELVESINFLLSNSLPLGRFVAAAFVRIDPAAAQGEVWVAGVPDVLLLAADGSLRRRFASHSLPLGIAAPAAGAGQCFAWEAGNRLLLVSDGVLELGNGEGEAFGEDRLLLTLDQVPPGEWLEVIHAALAAHAGDTPPHDDMSVLVVD